MGKFTDKLNCELSFTFDDFLLKPGSTSILPSGTDVSTRITRNIKLNIPVLSAAMDTVTETNMAIEMAKEGGLGVIHRNMDIENQADMIKKIKNEFNRNYTNASFDKKGRLLVAAAVGLDEERVKKLLEAEADLIVIDTAHAHNRSVLNFIRLIKNNYNCELVGGNIATPEAAEDLIAAGADCLKVGIGPGSICSTRIVTGVGVPQLTAVANVADVAEDNDIPVIADGGVKYPSDIAKAIAVGADAVMLGNILAGTDEAPGEISFEDGKKFKRYRGMGSKDAMAERYFQKNSKFVPEGVEGVVPYKGSLRDIIFSLIGGLKSSMSYVGASNIAEMKNKSRLSKMTKQGIDESHPHSISLKDENWS